MDIYADNAATTKMSTFALEAMIACMTEIYGNPSSIHSIGQQAHQTLTDSRNKIASCLGCQPKEIIFTSGGSESDNQALRSAAVFGAKNHKKHIVSTAFEHHQRSSPPQKCSMNLHNIRSTACHSQWKQYHPPSTEFRLECREQPDG